MNPETPLDRTEDPHRLSWSLRGRFLDHTPPAEDISDAVAAGVELDPLWLREIGALAEDPDHEP